MLRRSDASQIDGGRLNSELSLPVIEYVLVKRKTGRVEAWGVKKEVAEAILNAFTSNETEPAAVSLTNLLKTALERPD